MPDLYLEYEIRSEIEKKLFYYWYQTADLVVDRVFLLGGMSLRSVLRTQKEIEIILNRKKKNEEP